MLSTPRTSVATRDVDVRERKFFERGLGTLSRLPREILTQHILPRAVDDSFFTDGFAQASPVARVVCIDLAAHILRVRNERLVSRARGHIFAHKPREDAVAPCFSLHDERFAHSFLLCEAEITALRASNPSVHRFRYALAGLAYRQGATSAQEEMFIDASLATDWPLVRSHRFSLSEMHSLARRLEQSGGLAGRWRRRIFEEHDRRSWKWRLSA